ncbi:MAG: bifunctional metallophosphatase/5'-nucleotidase, partial [Muribaculaceae bacterium]|nr:bifunctional metallophosphatase/5'-nucleotidase [Muribaculaceae bacterium]
MKKNLIYSFLLAVSAIGAVNSLADNLVILHTNDTHSNIDVAADGTGGILPRKAIIDSVRNAENTVILVDAGDMVQGTLYFNYFKGDVEYPLFNMM